jgi:hypothetical protein
VIKAAAADVLGDGRLVRTLGREADELLRTRLAAFDPTKPR